MSLSSEEVEKLTKWIEYHIKGFENDQNPQLLASYIKSLILRQASQQRMVAVLRDFMDEKAEDFVHLLDKHLKTKDFTIPEINSKEKIKTTAPKKQENTFKLVIEEVKPESLVARPVITESTPPSQKKSKKDIAIKDDSKTEKDTWKSRDKDSSSISTQSSSRPKYTSSSQSEKKETYSKSFSTKSKEKYSKSSARDDKSKDKIRSREKENKSLRYKDKYTKKSRSKRSPSPYSSNDYDYSDYYTYDNDDNGDDYENEYYSYDSYLYDDERPKKRLPPLPKFTSRNKVSQTSRFTRNYKNKDNDKSYENERRPPYIKNQRNQKKFKDFKSNQRNNRNEDITSNPTKHTNYNEDIQTNNNTIHEPSEVDREHIYIIAVCGIPSQFNTVGHILKEFNRFGLIYGIQIVQEQKMALIEYSDLEAAYRAVNSRHRFFKNSTIKVDYAVQIGQDLLDPIAEKIRQQKLLVENKKKEKLLKQQRDFEARTNALAQAAAMAAAAINNSNTENNNSDKELEESEELLLKTLSEKIDEYEKLENCERKEKLKNDIEELSSFLEYVS